MSESQPITENNDLESSDDSQSAHLESAPSEKEPTESGQTKFISENASIEEEKKGDETEGEGKKGGRRKITIEFIENKSRRHVTFSKRKAGLIKKAYELSTLTGTQVLLLVASETGNVYTFATPKLQPLITKQEGKSLIQACLNPPEQPPQNQTPPHSQRMLSQESGGGVYQHEKKDPTRSVKDSKVMNDIPPYGGGGFPSQHNMMPYNSMYSFPSMPPNVGNFLPPGRFPQFSSFAQPGNQYSGQYPHYMGGPYQGNSSNSFSQDPTSPGRQSND